MVLGGPEISVATLGNFFTFHTAAVPVALAVLAAWHFWRVRRAGGVVHPPGEEGAKVMFWPHLLLRETAQGLAIVAVIFVLAAAFGAPLGEAANPGMSPNPAQAPWYFAGFQELLIHFPPVVAVLVLPLLGLAAWIALPWLVRGPVPEGVWFLSPAGRRTAVAGAGFGILGALALVLASGLRPPLSADSPTWGTIPLAVFALAGWALGAWAHRRPGAGRAEALQAVVVMVVAVFVVLTLVGALFRGEGMALVWPGGGA
jgi:quinol-cytochrome oxidoreductase complex cytochrome b subunit